MSKINFEKIGKIFHSLFDSDSITVQRLNNNGEYETVYSDLPCNFEVSEDSPKGLSLDEMPAQNRLVIHLSNDFIIQQGDFITAKKLSHSGKTLHEYSGTCGAPTVLQARQKIVVELNFVGN